MDAISIAIACLIVGGVIGGWMVRAEVQRKESARQEAEWVKEDAELARINSTRRNFGREPVTPEMWRQIRRAALEKAEGMARDAALYDAARDGERWKPDAPIWQKLGDTGPSPNSDRAG